MNAALINPFTNSGAHVPEAPESAAAIACPQPRAAAAPVSDGVGAKPILAFMPSEAATDPGREPVVATLSHNKITQAVEIQSSDDSTEVRRAKTGNKAGSIPEEARCPSATRFVREEVQGAAIQPCAGATPSSSEANDDMERLIGVAGKRRRRPLALPPFAPDFPALWKAMHDKSAPRAVLDPLWADESPLFLKG